MMWKPCYTDPPLRRNCRHKSGKRKFWSHFEIACPFYLKDQVKIYPIKVSAIKKSQLLPLYKTTQKSLIFALF